MAPVFATRLASQRSHGDENRILYDVFEVVVDRTVNKNEKNKERKDLDNTGNKLSVGATRLQISCQK